MTMNADHGAAQADHHVEINTKSHAVLLSIIALAWVAAYAVAFVTLGLGGFISVATFSAWGMLALIVVMTAGG